MAINLKVASIVIATLAITFSSFTLVKFTIGSNGHHHAPKEDKQMIDAGGVVPPKDTSDEDVKEPWASKPTKSTTTESREEHKRNRYNEFYSKFHHKTTLAERIIGIVVAIISIVTSFMVFGAVSDDYCHNQRRRHMMLPFVIYHSLLTFFHAMVILYVAITYRAYFDVLVLPILVYMSLVFVTILGISFVAAYHKSLSRMAGFSYAQMEDVKKPVEDEVKVPLA